MLRFYDSRISLLEGKIIVFITLGISKIVYLVFLTVIPNSLMEELQPIRKRLCGTPNVKILVKKTLCNNLKNGELKHVDISSKNLSLQCSWFRKLCVENFHEW